MAGHPLQRSGGVDKLFYLLVGLIEVAELLAEPQRVIQGDVQGVGHQLGDDVHIGVGHIQHPARVPDHAPGGHGAEGDNPKSISISGMLTRSGFRNRSKYKLYFMGSISVMLRQ